MVVILLIYIQSFSFSNSWCLTYHFFSRWCCSLLSLGRVLLWRIANCRWQFDPFHYSLTTYNARVVFTKIKTWELPQLTSFSLGKTSIERIISHELIGNLKLKKYRKTRWKYRICYSMHVCISSGWALWRDTLICANDVLPLPRIRSWLDLLRPLGQKAEFFSFEFLLGSLPAFKKIKPINCLTGVFDKCSNKIAGLLMELKG